MKSAIISGDQVKTFLLVFEPGDEVMKQLTSFAAKNNLKSSHFSAIGAFSDATLAFYDFSVKDYKKIPVNEQVEVLIFSGNISLFEDKPRIHSHVVLGKSDGSTVGGHLLSAHVKPTLEVFLTEYSTALHRARDEETNLPLLDLNR